MSDATADPLAQWHHPLVRDLAWLLHAPDLIDMACPGRPTREDLGFTDGARLEHFLGALEASPEGLEQRVGNTVSGRMGLYHERLWQYLLDKAPNTRLLAHNLRVHHGKLTLGELDLLYQQRTQPALCHLEVAIKFYLGLPKGPGQADDQARWIGPGGADSLACKRQHLYRHQLRLIERPETQLAIRLHTRSHDPGPPPLTTMMPRVAMPGVLFYPWRYTQPPPREATPHHLRGRWLRWGEWRNFRNSLPRHVQGAWLAKPHWLALPRDNAFTPLRQLEARLAEHFTGTGSPVQIALCRDGRRERVFVVDDPWPNQIPLPPWPRG